MQDVVKLIYAVFQLLVSRCGYDKLHEVDPAGQNLLFKLRVVVSGILNTSLVHAVHFRVAIWGLHRWRVPGMRMVGALASGTPSHTSQAG